MCRTMEVMRNEAEIKGVISGAKNFNISNDKIVEYLVSTYNYLSEDEAVKLVEEFDED